MGAVGADACLVATERSPEHLLAAIISRAQCRRNLNGRGECARKMGPPALRFDLFLSPLSWLGHGAVTPWLGYRPAALPRYGQTTARGERPGLPGLVAPGKRA